MGRRQKQKRVDAIRHQSKNAKVAYQETQGQFCVNALCSNAENVFAQLRPLVDELKMVVPYGVGRNGAKLPLIRTPELQVLQSPNDDMGWAEFADLMFSTWLTEKELNIHVWKDANKVYGYSILPVGTRRKLGNRTYFQTTLADGSLVELSNDEVMTLRFSRNPRNIDNGISPGIASMVWAQIDDVLAQYQLAHFENGAVPAYITIIRASTEEKYRAKRDELEHGFHGSKNKGKTLYLWRQFLDDGQERDEVEVKTIQGSNASLAIKEIMSIVNDKINKAFGVSEFILGNDSSAKYDNAELSQQQFMQHRVYPALFTFWSQFQHELNRILPKGLPYSISWELPIPELTDRMKVKAETEKIKQETANLRVQKDKIEEEKRKLLEEQEKLRKDTLQVEANTNRTHLDAITAAVNAGATPESAVAALGLDDKWLEVARSIADKATSSIENGSDSEQTIQSGDAQNPSLSDVTALIYHDCGHSHHTDDAITPTFTAEEKREKEIYDMLLRIVQSVVTELTESGEILTKEQIRQIRDDIVKQLIEEADLGANDGAEHIQAIVLGDTAEEIAAVLKDGGYHVSEDFITKLRERTETLIQRLDEHVREKAHEVLDVERETPLTAKQIEDELAKVLPRGRAATIARNETVNAFRAGHLENDKYLANKYGLKLRKVWRVTHDDRACPICKAMDGQVVALDSAFPDSVTGEDGVRYVWERDIYNQGGEIPSAHVNCRCHFETEIIDD